MSSNNEKWECPLCGGTKIGVRNFYKNQAPDTIGFAIEEYCEGCGVTLANIPYILEDKSMLAKTVKILLHSKYDASKQTQRER